MAFKRIFNRRQRRFDALLIYLILEGVSALLFQVVVTIYVVFYAKTVGLDALQIVLLGTVFEATIFLFEIPTGIVADVYSRRLSVILGVLLTGIGFFAEGIVPTFAIVLLAEIASGIGATFMSGATEAWIADEIGAARAGQAFVRAAQVKQIAGIVGIILSVALASARLTLPFVASGAVFLLLGLFLIAFMPETGFRPAPKGARTTLQTLSGTLHAGVGLIRVRPVLLVILVIGFIAAFHGEGFDYLWQKHILDDFTLPGIGALDPVVWFGIMGLGANLISLGLGEIIRRRVDLSSHKAAARALLLIYALQPIGIVVFSLTGNFGAALVAYWGIMALRWASDPVSKAWLNQNIPAQIRATVFSLHSQTGALGEMLGGAPIGWIAVTFSLRAALAATGAILALTLPLYGYTLRRHTAEIAVIED